MLFILTGGIQMGKTRWLQTLCDELPRLGVPVSGVIAPGIWVEHREASDPDAAPTFEKLGINNVLLPSGEVVPFARRRDLARADGEFAEAAVSTGANFGWAVDEAAFDRVNAHFAALASGSADAAPSLLVVDELGRFELERGQGLTQAMDLLAQGPSERFPHALIVVRESLVEQAVCKFGALWDESQPIGPNDAGRTAILRAFSLA